ncbi:MAG TPA: sigma 54-interacting transcriptional regulator [Myxococcales bacterium]|nr:sigma 54-interacting transcriptional regulator [Myxococcales bacterium]
MKPLEGLFTSENEAMRALLEGAARAGQRPSAPVRIHGEVGTGKELLARFIHEHTPAKKKAAFVKVASAGSTEELLEAELFGQERAGSGRAETPKGALEHASGGTLFLEDAAELPARLQVQLLRALKTGRFHPVGSVQERPFDARVIVSTVPDLARAVRKGAFRSDLFHRLDVLSLALPPIRSRREDIVPLARWFLGHLGREWVRPVPALSPEAEVALVVHDWPGNVRELRNVMESAMISEPGQLITAASLPLGKNSSEREEALLTVRVGEDEAPPPMAEVEKRYIEAVLRRAKGNRSEVSRVLGLSYPTVTRKIAEYGIKAPD